MRKFFTSMAALAMAGISLTMAVSAGDYPHGGERQLPQRPSRTRHAVPPVKSLPKQVMAGADGNKALYGMAFNTDYSFEIEGYQGPVQIAADGYHQKITDKAIINVSGCYFGDGKYLSIQYTETIDGTAPQTNIDWVVYDAETWDVEGKASYTPNSFSVIATDLAYDPTTGHIYGAFSSEDKYFSGTVLGYANLDNQFEPVVTVGTLPTKISAIACDKEGSLTGIGSDGVLYSINKYTGELTKIGDIAFPSYVETPSFGYQSAVADWDDGMIYYAFCDSYLNPFILKIDPANGNATCVANLGFETGEPDETGTSEVFTGLFFKQKYTNTGASTPAAVTDFMAVPEGTTMNVNVSFTMPSNDTDGKELTGNLKYRICDGTSDIFTGSAAPGEKVENLVTISGRKGKLALLLYVSAGTAESVASPAYIFVGPDTPVIASATARANGTKVTVSWAEATAREGGNLDPVTYEVVRMPENKVIAEAETALRHVDVVESPVISEYYYAVIPHGGAETGDSVISRKVWAGQYFGIPFDEDFSNESRFMLYPAYDADNDGNTWYYNSRYGCAAFTGATAEADDYLCIGPFDIRDGQTYNAIFTASVHSNSESMGVYFTTDPTDPTAYRELIEPAFFINYEGKDFRSSYTADSDSKGYFAVRCTSSGNSNGLYIKRFRLSVISDKSPERPTGLTHVPQPKGATIRFTLPTGTIGGDAARLTAVNIYRDDNLLAHLTDGVSDGGAMEYDDQSDASSGMHTYSICAVNDSGEGHPAFLEAYLGLDYPAPPTNFRIEDDLDNPSLLHFSWDAPTVGVHGGYIDPSTLNYSIDFMSFDIPEANGTRTVGKGLKHDIEFPSNGKECLLAASVWGENELGTYQDRSQVWKTTVSVFGEYAGLPIRESWPAGGHEGDSYWVGVGVGDDKAWDNYVATTDGSQANLTPQDGDSGALGFFSGIPGGKYSIITSRFCLKGTSNPTLVFYANCLEGCGSFDVEVIADNQPAKTVYNVPVGIDTANKWQRISVSLKEFTDARRVQVRFMTVNRSDNESTHGLYAMIDNASISDAADTDIAVLDFTAPVKVNVNKKAVFSLKLRNNGSSSIEEGGYTVRLFKNGEPAADFTGKAIKVDATTTMTLSDTPSVTDPESTSYCAEVIFDADKFTDNNRSTSRMVRIVPTVYPTVTDLHATNENGVTLTWSDPSTTDMPATPITENFDSYKPFIIENIGNWTVYDGDKKPTLTIASTMGPLTYDHIGEPMAWQIIDPEEALIWTWSPRSGSNVIASFQACIDGTRDIDSDDWLISPELNGSAQTISFYARAGQNGYTPELFDVLGSTSGTDIDDFTKVIATNVEVEYDRENVWTEYSFTLPEGVRHFAIVHKSYNKFALVLDDITFIPAGASTEHIELQGYNVYRDGKRINSELVADPEYVDTDVEQGKEYNYAVSAVWDKGESALSNVVTVTTSGIEGIENSAMNIYAGHLTINVSGVSGQIVEVFTPAGICVASTKSEAPTVSVKVSSPGIYIVKVGNEIVKLVVK